MSTRRHRVWFVLFASVLLAVPVSAQELRPVLSGSAADSAQPLPEQLPEYQVGPGDVLLVQVFGLAKVLDERVTVSNSGRIHISSVGVFSILNLTANQIEDQVVQRLKDEQLVKDPWVRIRVVEYYSQPVYVVGEVNAPGQFMISSQMRLLDAVGKAGGFTTGAGENGFLLRRLYRPRIGVNLRYDSIEDSPQTSQMLSAYLQQADYVDPPANQGEVQIAPGETIRINLEQLKKAASPELNVRLQGGDIFFVPRRQREYIYIVGEVFYPGAYGLPREYDHITAARAVSYAGGPLKTAKVGSAFIMRRDESGEVIGVPFDFGRVIRGEEPDLPIKPEDIIFVPRSVGKTIGYGMLDLVAHLTQQFIIF